MTTASIVQRVWNYCNTLRDDGVSYGDYVEQLTYLLFLKMADEYSKPPYNRDIKIPKNLNWESLKNKSGAELEAHYIHILNELGKEKGMIGEIFFKAQNKIQDPAKLYKLIQLIDDENWVILGADVTCYNPQNRFKRKETERFKKFSYDEIISRDKTNLDIFWLKDESLGDMDNLPDPDVIALEIVENIEAGLASFKEIVEGLNGRNYESD
ncbi:MAG: type I restriction-modification system subunit M N-terminal domain-containing protein [Ignavibacteriaceae bacterium]|nr:type I restriction-modification system subunit M N-terminal domain-containing protein [Ignavibacteriaceae bacterium]